ncbi:MAG: small subunit ribosomal protein S13 [Flavobacteriaceae bacterium]|jgi:small subunit ribosomal protein S13
MRILGITIPENKRIEIGLTVIHGIGRARAHTILDKAGIDHGAKPSEISEDKEAAIRTEIESFTLEGDLRREKIGNIKRLKDILSYRGTRHIKGLPSRGQRTKTNSRTGRGNVRKTMASGRVKVSKT